MKVARGLASFAISLVIGFGVPAAGARGVPLFHAGFLPSVYPKHISSW
jgi:hypothetical protein